MMAGTMMAFDLWLAPSFASPYCPQLTEVKFRLETDEGANYETMEMLHFKENIRQCECGMNRCSVPYCQS